MENVAEELKDALRTLRFVIINLRLNILYLMLNSNVRSTFHMHAY